MDELSNNNLLLPGWSEELPRQSPLRNVTAVDPDLSHSDPMMADYAEKPLPDIPWRQFTSEFDRPQKKPSLSPPGKTPRVIRKGERSAGRAKPAPPVPTVIQNLTNAGLLPDLRAYQPRSPNTLKRSMTEVGNLNVKISDLMDHKTAPDGERIAKGKGIAGIDRVPRLSPLRRGRQALAKASRALAGQLSRSSSTSHTSDPNVLFGAREDSLPGSSHGSMLSLRPNTDDDSSLQRHTRRIAEGENLGRAKIKAMTSDGHIRRKPLPLQDSTNLEPSSGFNDKEDAARWASGNRERNDSPTRSNRLQLDVDYPEHRGSRDGETSSQFDHLRIKPQPRRTTLPPATRISRSYLVVNGLREHPDTLVFASPPHKITMPRPRGASLANIDNQKRVSSSTKSIIGFEDRRDDDGLGSASQKGRPRVASNGSVSIKRKSASRDLRSQLSTAMKRTKRGSVDSNDSKEDMVSSSGNGQRDGADRPSFITRERNRLSSLFNNKTVAEAMEAERRGLGNFDGSKENEPIPAADDKSRSPRDRGSGGKKSSSRRRSSLFSRESRTQTQPQTPTQLLDRKEYDDMAIDELQMDNQAYQLGGTRL